MYVFLDGDRERSSKWIRVKQNERMIRLTMDKRLRPSGLDSLTRTKDDPFFFLFFYLFNFLQDRFFWKYNLIVFDHFSKEAILRDYSDIDLSKTSIFILKINNHYAYIDKLRVSRFSVCYFFMLHMWEFCKTRNNPRNPFVVYFKMCEV